MVLPCDQTNEVKTSIKSSASLICCVFSVIVSADLNAGHFSPVFVHRLYTGILKLPTVETSTST